MFSFWHSLILFEKRLSYFELEGIFLLKVLFRLVLRWHILQHYQYNFSLFYPLLLPNNINFLLTISLLGNNLVLLYYYFLKVDIAFAIQRLLYNWHDRNQNFLEIQKNQNFQDDFQKTEKSFIV